MHGVLNGYSLQMLDELFHPESDPRASTNKTIQTTESKKASGSAGLLLEIH
jgi:hypothetical protein